MKSTSKTTKERESYALSIWRRSRKTSRQQKKMSKRHSSWLQTSSSFPFSPLPTWSPRSCSPSLENPKRRGEIRRRFISGDLFSYTVLLCDTCVTISHPTFISLFPHLYINGPWCWRAKERRRQLWNVLALFLHRGFSRVFLLLLRLFRKELYFRSLDLILKYMG